MADMITSNLKNAIEKNLEKAFTISAI